MLNTHPVLVIGSTGYLGSKIVTALLAQGHAVRALVRPGTDPSHISARGVEIVRGDLLDRSSLDLALKGADAVVTSAAGYNKRRATDSSLADTIGFENLAKAAKAAGTRRVVLTGVLKSELATDVPHFRNKQAQENLLEKMNVPFVSIRPGSFLNQSSDFFSRDIKKGKMVWIGSPNVPMSWITTEDLAKYLAMAVTAKGIEGQRIEVGLDQNLTPLQLAKVVEEVVGNPIKLQMLPWRLVGTILSIAGVFKETAKDFRANLAFFQTGNFKMDDHRPQTNAFGAPPAAKESIKKWLMNSGAIPENKR
ncbi:MAG: SDR family oxidoreductase [Bermanella sp.]